MTPNQLYPTTAVHHRSPVTSLTSAPAQAASNSQKEPRTKVSRKHQKLSLPGFLGLRRILSRHRTTQGPNLSVRKRPDSKNHNKLWLSRSRERGMSLLCCNCHRQQIRAGRFFPSGRSRLLISPLLSGHLRPRNPYLLTLS